MTALKSPIRDQDYNLLGHASCRVDAVRAQSRRYWLRRLLLRWLLLMGTIMLVLVVFIQYLRIGGYDTPLCNLFHRIHHLLEFISS